MRNKAVLWEIIFLVLIIALSLYPRLWNLNSVPRMIVDEPANLRDIQKILQKPPGLYVADFEWSFSQATLVHYPTILMGWIFGTQPNLFVLRLSSIVLSLAALLPFYFLAREYTARTIALSLTLLFSFSYYYLQFSRVGWTNIFVVTLGLYFLWFLKLALAKNHPLWLLLPAVTAGMIFYGYRGGEVYLLAGFLYFLYWQINTHLKLRKILLNAAIFFGTFLLVSAPWLSQISRNWELYNLRQRVVYVFNANRPYHGLVEDSDILRYQVLTSLESWLLLAAIDGGGIENLRYLPLKDPPVNAMIKSLFIIGLVLALFRFKETFIWLIIFILGLILGQILTVDPPNGSRALVLLPVIYLLPALTLEKLYQLSGRHRLFLVILVILTLIVAYLDFSYYRYWMSWIKL